jgi:hypothetical protein
MLELLPEYPGAVERAQKLLANAESSRLGTAVWRGVLHRDGLVARANNADICVRNVHDQMICDTSRIMCYPSCSMRRSEEV